ncbi:MAG: hypothetical protein E7480_00730 [Ruminococcaceae bacterium]|nr:hypothetical protein [Oscillospiraceae bacterium]
MDFRKKLKIRLFIAISYIVLGLCMIIVFNIINTQNDFLSSFGFALVVIGIVRMRNYFLITKNEETIKKQQIAENDERNIAIANKAKSISFMIYVMVACIAIIILQILNKSELASILGANVCFILVVYWISYFIIRKKS